MQSFSSLSPSPRKTGRISVIGRDAAAFLQGLITADIRLLASEETKNLYACLLTPQGKFLHDFHVSKIDGGYNLRCEGGDRTLDLLKRLSIYKLRADVTFTADPEALPLPDEDTLSAWDKERYARSFPDGSEDADIGVSTLAELNLDTVAVSYTKGCYIGQEIVARMHHRNLGKKHPVGVDFLSETPPTKGTLIDGIGEMRSSNGRQGLILMTKKTEETLRQTPPAPLPFRFL